MYLEDSLQALLQVLSELHNTMQVMKSQNESSVNNDDDETLNDDDNRIANNEINSFPDTIKSEDAQNQLPPLPERTLSPIQIPEAQRIDTFTGNE